MEVKQGKMTIEQKKLVTDFLTEGGEKIISSCIKQSIKSSPNDELVEEFRSIAYIAVCEAAIKYDETRGAGFPTYAMLNIKARLISELRRRFAGKRSGMRMVPMDAYINDATRIDVTANNYTDGCLYDGSVDEFKKSLTIRERKVVDMIIGGYSLNDAVAKLNVSAKEQSLIKASLREYSKLKILKQNDIVSKRTEDVNMTVRKTAERYTEARFVVRSFISMVENKDIRDDHPLQRKPDQWSIAKKSLLIQTMLEDVPISNFVIAEQMQNGISQLWLIDGLQRYTTISEYINDRFSISSSIPDTNIHYKENLRDENGVVMTDENNVVVSVDKSFDIKHKRFSQLPKVLQEKILGYDKISAIKHLCCTDEDIEKDIRRYNNCKPMTAAQSGITFAGTECSRLIKTVAQHSFLKDKGCLKAADFRNGNVDRVVAESIMAINFVGQWKQNNELNNRYLSQHANKEMFVELESIMDDLYNIIPDGYKYTEMLKTKELLVLFANYSYFKEYGIDLCVYRDFFDEWSSALINRPDEDGVSYAEYASNGTKARSKVIGRISRINEALDKWLEDKSYLENDKDDADEDTGIAVKDYDKNEAVTLGESVFELKKCISKTTDAENLCEAKPPDAIAPTINKSDYTLDDFNETVINDNYNYREPLCKQYNGLTSDDNARASISPFGDAVDDVWEELLRRQKLGDTVG